MHIKFENIARFENIEKNLSTKKKEKIAYGF
jgi:hypothetical protein